MPCTIKVRTVSDLESDPQFSILVDEYAKESVIPELGTANPQMEMYRKLENAGVLTVLTAHDLESTIGFIAFVVLPMPHQGTLAATVQSFFVRSQSRKQGAGLRLLREAEQVSFRIGAVGFFASAPLGGRLASVLPRSGYRPTNLSFFKGLV